MKSPFEKAFEVALAENNLDEKKFRKDVKLMLFLIDMYYRGEKQGAFNAFESIKEKQNVAVPSVSTPAVS